MEAQIYSYSGFGKINEDYCACYKLDDSRTITILADGMGGLSNGDLAARLVADTIFTFISAHFDELSPEELLCQALNSANEAINNKCYELKCRMGASIAVVYSNGPQAYYTWLGNVRIYLNKAYSEVKLLTQDHVYSPQTDNKYKDTYLTRCIKGKELREIPPVELINLTTNDILFLTSSLFCAIT